MSFENPARPTVENKETPDGLKEYFQSYISDAESQENEEGKAAFVDLDKVTAILKDIDTGEYASAREYLDGEIARMQGIQQNMNGFDMEEGKPYLEKITILRQELAD